MTQKENNLEIEIINEDEITQLGGATSLDQKDNNVCGNLRKCDWNSAECPKLEECNWNG